jgi:ribonuclease BN (tRNA processing enzyme)
MPAQSAWIILGSGGGAASPDRASSGHLLQVSSTLLMFDCGDGVTGSFLRAGKNLEDVDAIFISHTHPDHLGGLPYFLQQLYLVQRRNALVIHLPEEAVAGFKSYLAMNYLFLERFPFAVEFQGLGDGEAVPYGDGVIIPRLNSHLTKFRGQPWMAPAGNRGECFSFEIRHDSSRIVYSSDIGSLDDLRFCGGADILLAEVTHVDIRELLQAAETWMIKTLVLTHLGPEIRENDIAGVSKFFSGNLIIARDGRVIPLS